MSAFRNAAKSFISMTIGRAVLRPCGSRPRRTHFDFSSGLGGEFRICLLETKELV